MSTETQITLIAIASVIALVIFFILIAYLVTKVFSDYTLEMKALGPVAFIMSAYFATCFLFGGIFSLIHLADKSAFTGIKENFVWDSIYLSFITILSIGYGDILPVNRVARFFVMVEGCVGLLFISVLLATVLNQAPKVVRSGLINTRASISAWHEAKS